MNDYEPKLNIKYGDKGKLKEKLQNSSKRAIHTPNQYLNYLNQNDIDELREQVKNPKYEEKFKEENNLTRHLNFENMSSLK